MKRLFFFFLLSMFFCSSINAQFSLLLEGGANYGKTTFTGAKIPFIIENENILGYYFMIAPYYQVHERVEVGLGLQYSREGYRFDALGDRHAMHLHYAKVIPELRLKVLGPIGILAGINIGYLTAEKFKEGENALFMPVTLFLRHNEFDFGLLAGLNISIAQINLSIKYNYGLQAIDTLRIPNRDGNIEETFLKNRFLQVGLGYRIDFKISYIVLTTTYL
jgi:hypothetical protein